MCGYFSGLSSPSVTEMTTTLRCLAEVEQRRADQVADVLDEQELPSSGCSALEGAGAPWSASRWQPAPVLTWTARAPGRPDPLGVEDGLLVALDHADRPARASAMVRSSSVVLPAPGELIRLSARDAALGEPGPVARGELVVLGEHGDLELEGVGAQRPASGSTCTCAWSCPWSCPWAWSCPWSGASRPDGRHPGRRRSPHPQVAHMLRPPPPTVTASSRPDSTSTSALPQAQSRKASASVEVRAAGAAVRPSVLLVDLERRRPRAGCRRWRARSRTSSASGTTPDSRPTRRRTTLTCRSPVRSSTDDTTLSAIASSCMSASSLRLHGRSATPAWQRWPDSPYASSRAHRHLERQLPPLPHRPGRGASSSATTSTCSPSRRPRRARTSCR